MAVAVTLKPVFVGAGNVRRLPPLVHLAAVGSVYSLCHMEILNVAADAADVTCYQCQLLSQPHDGF